MKEANIVVQHFASQKSQHIQYSSIKLIHMAGHNILSFSFQIQLNILNS